MEYFWNISFFKMEFPYLFIYLFDKHLSEWPIYSMEVGGFFFFFLASSSFG
jgi:hypothetical protein